MSNKKVEQRKQDKHGRKKGVSGEKLKSICGITVAVVIVCAVIAFFAYQIDQSYFAYDRIASVDLQSMSTAVSNVQSVNVASGDAESTSESDSTQSDNTDSASTSTEK